ncbi:MAG: hypothetical protein HQK53_00815 [Oligoflexia bacterium]|nr:hypothetical protein [Oligoflexia bacterium]
MLKESKSMHELHEIRLRIYERTKDMSATEKAKYINARASEAKKSWKLISDKGNISKLTKK